MPRGIYDRTKSRGSSWSKERREKFMASMAAKRTNGNTVQHLKMGKHKKNDELDQVAYILRMCEALPSGLREYIGTRLVN